MVQTLSCQLRIPPILRVISTFFRRHTTSYSRMHVLYRPRLRPVLMGPDTNSRCVGICGRLRGRVQRKCRIVYSVSSGQGCQLAAFKSIKHNHFHMKKYLLPLSQIWLNCLTSRHLRLHTSGKKSIIQASTLGEKIVVFTSEQPHAVSSFYDGWFTCPHESRVSQPRQLQHHHYDLPPMYVFFVCP
jgi:hypothetical protein